MTEPNERAAAKRKAATKILNILKSLSDEEAKAVIHAVDLLLDPSPENWEKQR